ncbi:hypothetical protein [Fodinibius halophilus]|uniref:Uncharacterized protein n=1 Tax=Fodinibius halophilus TaxID=1736908 RepID=A0A6M1TAW6_9BACT|nr:hypothetical protein [Fodinibius halophilus]NGP89563.1 hypothetical protein [Fodinibius halophilus]
MRSNSLTLFIICLVIVGFFQACDVAGEESYDWEPGESLNIMGPVEVAIPQDTTTADTNDVVPVTKSYYSRAFTIKKDYSWTVEGSASKDSVYRDGEYIDVTFGNATGSDTTTTTISVDDGEYQGSITIKAFRQSNESAGI